MNPGNNHPKRKHSGGMQRTISSGCTTDDCFRRRKDDVGVSPEVSTSVVCEFTCHTVHSYLSEASLNMSCYKGIPKH
jgi:hypothetical protein